METVTVKESEAKTQFQSIASQGLNLEGYYCGCGRVMSEKKFMIYAGCCQQCR